MYRHCILVGYIGRKVEIQHTLSEHSQRETFPTPNLGFHGTGRYRCWKIILNLGIKSNPKICGENYGQPNWGINPFIDAFKKRMK